MKASFDHMAPTYDDDFTNSSVGSLQRQKIWDYLEKSLPNRTLSILELNCGTGEDAARFAGQGHWITATDLSVEMLAVAKQKATKMSIGPQITFMQCDISHIEKIEFKRKYDLIFSNFGGLNCVDAMALKKLSKVSSRLLKANGRFIGVIMPRVCLWESLYFLTKGKVKKAFRRLARGPLNVEINNKTVETWYYSPGRIRKIFKGEFRPVGLKPVGFSLPPSYLQNFFNRRAKLLYRLDRFEDAVNRFSFLSRYSDHFLIDFELKKTSTS